MEVFRLTTLDELAPHADDWDRLARGVPFRVWAWASAWWRHYEDDTTARDGRQLFVLGVFDRGDRLVGVAPWYTETSAASGRVLRFLGSGEICSDHLSVLCEPGLEDRVAEALAEWLTGPRPSDDVAAAGRGHNDWDLLELAGVDADDKAVGCLTDQLALRGNTVSSRPGPNCWQIELPGDWEAYLGRLSKAHRKKLRRADRDLLSSGRVALHTVQRLDELDRATEILIDLHQRRSHDLGRPGCFASRRFSAFHRDVMPALLRTGHLQLHRIELDGRPIAAEYQLTGNGKVYAYQAGMDPEAMKFAPGQLANIATIRRAIESGYRTFDFLRGDEPYKAHWRAEPRRSVEIRVVPARASARLRHGLWTAGESVKGWIKSGLKMVGARRG